MDGYAVNAWGSPAPEPYLLERQAFGRGPTGSALRKGHAVPISTGDPLPRGANAVVRVEAARVEDGRLYVATGVRRGQDVVPRGEFLARGSLLLDRGQQVTPYHLSALIAEGRSEAWVHDPRVAILPIGSELRGAKGPREGGTPDSIGPVVRALLHFARPTLLPAVADEPETVRRAIHDAISRCELLFTIGGASRGNRDATKRVLERMGTLLFEGVTVNVLKQGGVALVSGRPVVVLPGQITSALTVFHEHGLHVLSRLVGEELRIFENVELGEEVTVHHRMDSTVLFRRIGGRIHPLPWGVAHGPALLAAEGFAVLRRGRTYHAGERIRWMRFLMNSQ